MANTTQTKTNANKWVGGVRDTAQYRDLKAKGLTFKEVEEKLKETLYDWDSPETPRKAIYQEAVWLLLAETGERMRSEAEKEQKVEEQTEEERKARILQCRRLYRVQVLEYVHALVDHLENDIGLSHMTRSQRDRYDNAKAIFEERVAAEAEGKRRREADKEKARANKGKARTDEEKALADEQAKELKDLRAACSREFFYCTASELDDKISEMSKTPFDRMTPIQWEQYESAVFWDMVKRDAEKFDAMTTEELQAKSDEIYNRPLGDYTIDELDNARSMRDMLDLREWRTEQAAGVSLADHLHNLEARMASASLEEKEDNEEHYDE